VGGKYKAGVPVASPCLKHMPTLAGQVWQVDCIPAVTVPNHYNRTLGA
jgi:hypothetical protein